MLSYTIYSSAVVGEPVEKQETVMLPAVPPVGTIIVTSNGWEHLVTGIRMFAGQSGIALYCVFV